MPTVNHAALARARMTKRNKSERLNILPKKESSPKANSLVGRLKSPPKPRTVSKRTSDGLAKVDPRGQEKKSLNSVEKAIKLNKQAAKAKLSKKQIQAAKNIQRIQQGRQARAQLSKEKAKLSKKQAQAAKNIQKARQAQLSKRAAQEELSKKRLKAAKNIQMARQAQLSKRAQAAKAKLSKKQAQAAKNIQRARQAQLSKRQFEKMERAVSPKAVPRASSVSNKMSPTRTMSPPATPRVRSVSNRMSPTPMRNLTPPDEISTKTPEWLSEASDIAKNIKPASRATDERIKQIRALPDTGKSLENSAKFLSDMDKEEFKMAAKAGKVPGVKWKELDGMQRCSPKAKRNTHQYCCQSVIFDKKSGKFRQCQKTLTAEDYKKGETTCTTHRNLD